MCSKQKDQPLPTPDLSPRHTGVPGCVWMMLGAGIALVLVIVGMLLIFVPAYRQGSSSVNPVLEKPTITDTVPASATYTPYITLTKSADPEQTAAPTPFQTAPGQTGIPDVLLVSTPSSRAGYLSISPYITADAMHYSLKVGDEVNLTWADYPPGALHYQITLIPDGGGPEVILIEDDNPTDGIGGPWRVPENIGGELRGLAVFPDGRLVTTVSGGWIYAKDPE